MDRTSVIGIIVGIIAIGVGLILKGVNITALFNPAAILIIFAGTIAAVLVAFPMSTLKNVPKLLKILFTEQKQQNIQDIISMFSEWAVLIRREGILALESQIDEVDDPFLTSGLQLAIDGQPPDFIRDVMVEKVNAMEERHREGAQIFSQAGTYAPTLGVLGAVIGLIAALGNLEDMDVLGSAISAAFMATLFGIFTGYMLWHPFANKLQEKSRKEAQIKFIMIEGILSLTAGESPQILREKLSSYLSSKELNEFIQGENNEQEEA